MPVLTLTWGSPPSDDGNLFFTRSLRFVYMLSNHSSGLLPIHHPEQPSMAFHGAEKIDDAFSTDSSPQARRCPPISQRIAFFALFHSSWARLCESWVPTRARATANRPAWSDSRWLLCPKPERCLRFGPRRHHMTGISWRNTSCESLEGPPPPPPFFRRPLISGISIEQDQNRPHPT